MWNFSHFQLNTILNCSCVSLPSHIGDLLFNTRFISDLQKVAKNVSVVLINNSVLHANIKLVTLSF